MKGKILKTNEAYSLIVDDEPDTCWALEHLLRKAGGSAERAASGHEALSLMESRCFSMVFLDAKLPDIEGLELARRLRDIDSDIRIVMVSGYFFKDDAAIKKALAEGLIYQFISKPFEHSEILAAMRMPTTSASRIAVSPYIAEAVSSLDNLSSIRASGSVIGA
jgi:CheY-like chemotaxis protein